MQTFSAQQFLPGLLGAARKNIGIKGQPKTLQSHQPTNNHPFDCGVANRNSQMPTANRRRPPPRQQSSFLSAVASNSWIIGTVVVGLFSIGMNYQAFNEVKRNQDIQTNKQEQVASSLAKFREDQIRSMGDVSVIKNNMQALDSNVRAIDGRVLVIERTFIEPSKKAK